jgi:hypothetical protein
VRLPVMDAGFATALVGVAALVAFGLAGSVEAATVTIGQVGGSGSACVADVDMVQTTPTSSVVPSGNWTVTSWSTQAGQGNAGPQAGQLQLEMWRATATPNVFMLVGISPVVTTTASGLNTFTLASPIAVQGGDLLGLRNITLHYGCLDIGAAGAVNGDIFATAPAPGDTRTLPPEGTATLNVAATLQSVTAPTPPTTTAPSPVVVTPQFTG